MEKKRLIRNRLRFDRTAYHACPAGIIDLARAAVSLRHCSLPNMPNFHNNLKSAGKTVFLSANHLARCQLDFLWCKTRGQAERKRRRRSVAVPSRAVSRASLFVGRWRRDAIGEIDHLPGVPLPHLYCRPEATHRPLRRVALPISGRPSRSTLDVALRGGDHCVLHSCLVYSSLDALLDCRWSDPDSLRRHLDGVSRVKGGDRCRVAFVVGVLPSFVHWAFRHIHIGRGRLRGYCPSPEEHGGAQRDGGQRVCVRLHWTFLLDRGFFGNSGVVGTPITGRRGRLEGHPSLQIRS